jgi:ankyrin repeat protein
VDVNRLNAEGRTALELAQARGDKQIVHLLKANGASDPRS